MSGPVTGKYTPRQKILFGLLGVVAVSGAVAFSPEVAHRVHLFRLQRMALSDLKSYCASHPDDLDALYRSGMEEAQAGRYLDASRSLVQVIGRDPTRLEVVNDYAVVLMAQKRYLEALQALSGLVKIRPDDARAWANLGRLHILNGMPFTAATELQNALKSDPNNRDVMRDLGTAEQQAMNYRASQKAYASVLRQNPSDVIAGVGLAQTYQALGNLKLAEKTAETVVKQHPEDADAIETLGDIRLNKGATPAELETALPLLKKAVALKPHNGAFLYTLGLAMRQLGRDAEAVKSLQDAYRYSPGDLTILYQLSQALLSSGDRLRGERLGNLYRIAMSRSKLRQAMEGRINLNARDWDARMRLAALLIEEHHFADAAAQCDIILAEQPGNRAAKRLLVRAALGQRFGDVLSGPPGPGSPATAGADKANPTSPPMG